MTSAQRFSQMPGVTGPEESRASREQGGFAWCRARAAEFGPVCRTTWEGRDAVLLTGERGIRAFYDGEHVVRAGARPLEQFAFIGDGKTPVVPQLDGEAHLRMKRALLRTVSPSALASHLPILDGFIARCVKRWLDRGEVDVIADTWRMSFDALSAIFLGTTGDDAMFATYHQLILCFLNGDLERGLSARDRMLAWYRDILAAKRALAADAPSDVIGILARAGELSDQEIVAEIQHLFIGSGGVRFAWCNTLAFLAEHPAVQQRARDEVRKLAVPPSLSELDESLYLQTMVEEVLRRSPILGLQIGRVAKALEIDGYLLPEGTLLVAGLYATSHDPSFFPDPDTFDPERPQKKARASGASEAGCPFALSARFSYLPFGGGDKSTGHRCLGEQVVYLAVKLLLARIARDHRWTVVNMAEVQRAPSPYQASDMWIRLTAAA